MNEAIFPGQNSYNKIVNLINYLDDNATTLLRRLHKIPAMDEQQIFQKKSCEQILLGLRDHSHQLKDEWITTANELQKFVLNAPEFSNEYKNLKKEMNELQRLINNILESEFFVNPEGVLVHLIKER